MMVTPRHYVLGIPKVLLPVRNRINGSSHEVRPIARPQRRRSVLLHKRRKLAQAIVLSTAIAFLPMLFEELQVRLVAVVVQMFLAVHPSLVLRKRVQFEQIRLHHLGNFCHRLVLVHRSSVYVPVEMRIPVLLVLDAASKRHAEPLETT